MCDTNHINSYFIYIYLMRFMALKIVNFYTNVRAIIFTRINLNCCTFGTIPFKYFKLFIKPWKVFYANIDNIVKIFKNDYDNVFKTYIHRFHAI